MIPAAFAHSTLQRFTLKAPSVSFPECNNGLPSNLPVSTSLKYVELPTISTCFYFIDPLRFLPVVSHIHLGLRVPHRLDHPHTYLRSLILELCYWSLPALHSFLLQLVVLKKLHIYGFTNLEGHKLFDYTCLLPIFSTLQMIDMNISICLNPQDETIERFQQELEEERLRNNWKQLDITSITQSRTTLKGLFKKTRLNSFFLEHF